MKMYFVSVATLLLTVAISCKKKPTSEPPRIKKWVVTTIAGDGTEGLANGPALSAKFHFPEDVAVTPNGTLYVTDVLNFNVRKIAGGQVSTFAGSAFGIVNGNGTAAQFKNPYSATLDANGNLYTTDENDPRIRKISPNADVTTHAGTEVSGFANGNAEVAQFRPGNSIVADAQGNIYVADAGNNRIRKVSVAGQVTTIAGTGEAGFREGAAALAQFSSPGGIALDKLGNLYIVDRFNFRIRKITAAGVVSTVAGSGVQGNQDGNAGEAQFSLDLHDIVVDNNGNLYVQDENRIRKITPQGVVSTIAGSTAGYADGEGPVAKFNFLAGMGIDVQGNLYVADLINNRIRKISLE